MARIPPPRRHSTKGQPPTADEAVYTLDQPDSGDLTPLNFKVSTAFRKAYKTYASRAGISMKELLDRSFREYQERHQVTD